MRAREFITESLQTLIEAKGHLDHPEDLVFLGGKSGIDRAITVIQQTAKEPQNITVKWDGYPALIFGRDDGGRFTIMDKHMFNKRDPAARQLHSIEQWIAYERARGERQRSELMGIIQNIWPGLERATANAKGYYWGDLLFRQPLQADSGLYKFRANPNGIAYTVDVDSPLGQLIGDKTAGIAVHQYLDPNAQSTDEARSLNGTIGDLKNNSPVAIIPSSMPVAPRIVIPEGLLARAQQLSSRYGDMIEQFMMSAPQARNTFNGLFTTYINNKIVNGDLKNLVAGFYDWVASRPMTPKMREKIDAYLKTNARAIRAIFSVWAAIYNLKAAVVRQLDRAAAKSPVKGYLSSGQQSQEGFVSGGLKFVNRLGFARQNLAGRQPAATLTEDVNKQMLVIYPGGFHPFHLGHASVFDHLAKKFDDGEVFVAATDTTTERPFEFTDKSFLANQSGVPKGRFVQVKSPYRSTEITQNYDPNNTVLVFAVSEKDHDRISFKPKKDGSPSYFQPYQSGDLAPMSQHGYIYVVPKIDFKIAGETIDSASKIRKMYAAADDQQRQRIIGDLYPHAKAPKRIKEILDRVLGGLNDEIKEADNPNYFGGSSQSAIPGTPPDLQPRPSAKKIRRERQQERELQRFMGH